MTLYMQTEIITKPSTWDGHFYKRGCPVRVAPTCPGVMAVVPEVLVTLRSSAFWWPHYTPDSCKTYKLQKQ